MLSTIYFIIKKIKIFVFIPLMFVFSACQSTLEKAGEEHYVAEEKWQELAKYASSTLTLYGIRINTKLALTKGDGSLDYKFNDISLSLDEDNFNVNLLSPNFDHKYICTPECVQLTEVEFYQQGNANTLLTAYFSKYEFELFKFYGDIYLLDERLAALSEQDPEMIIDYLHWITLTASSFETLSGLILYLQDNVTPDRFDYFVKNKLFDYKHLYSQLSQKQKGAESDKHNSLINTPDELWLKEKSDKLPAEQLLWTQVSPNKTTDLTIWLNAKKATFKVGDTVCSFNKNYFGTVQSISSKSVVVGLIGQSKAMLDGTASDVGKGELFRKESNSSYLPMDEDKAFNRSDIAKCNLS